MSWRVDTPDERLAYDTEAEAVARERQIRGIDNRKTVAVVVWRDGYEGTSAALCGPVSDCAGKPVVGSTEVLEGPQIEFSEGTA